MDKEYILCAAIWYQDYDPPPHSVINISMGIVLCGHRHPHIICQCTVLLGKRQAEMGRYEQGFLTSKNRFVSREEAAELAYKAEQIDQLKETLFSEDLY